MIKKEVYKLIFNPHAGVKRKMLKIGNPPSLEEMKALLLKYQIWVDLAPTKYAGHATQLARESIKEGYTTVLVAGGDGTVGEVANGLVGSDIKLGILPIGSFMNIARMLSIPTEIEKAIMVIKIGRSRKIDVGCVTKLDGEKLSKPYYFLETAGFGIEAQIQEYGKEFEEGNILALFSIIKILKNFYSNTVKIVTDEREIEEKATLISIANGPYTGAGLNLSPDAKLNDHRLNVTIYKMNKLEMIKYFLRMKLFKKTDKRRLTTIQTKKVRIIPQTEMQIHADATLFGVTPAEFKIIPSALQMICGFPENEDESYLVSRTILDP